MAELIPIPLSVLLTRAFLEYQRQGKIFDLPREKLFRGFPDLDTSVRFHGYPASTPLGPAAGPHDQLAQNIVLSWLGGSRIIELKTVQIMDELKIARPCIDMTNVGYNVEWSQELKLEQSLQEYVTASMLIHILKESRLLGEDFHGGDTIFDMSLGYSLEGIRSGRVCAWIEGMKDATRTINRLRRELTGPLARYRDLPFARRVSDTVTLSTFHGCPAREIEGIVTFLLSEMDVHVCVKLNPTLLGKEEVEHLLHDVMGYREIQVAREAFEKDLQFADALDLIPRLNQVARRLGKRLVVKFSNTLVVKNHLGRFAEEVMYLSGPPLHVLTLNLVKKFRQQMGAAIPISFSAGLDANNVANAVAMNFVPVTACSDLLRAGGYGRLIRYTNNLGDRMRQLGAARIPDFILRHAGQGQAAVERTVAELGEAFRRIGQGCEIADLAPVLAWLGREFKQSLNSWLATPVKPLAETCAELRGSFRQIPGAHTHPELAEALKAELAGLEQHLVDTGGLLNTPVLVKQATEDPRYRWERNHGVPRKIGSRLWLYDCINCDKCVPDCPNDANFAYEAATGDSPYDSYELRPGGVAVPVPGGIFAVSKPHQLANYADACNDCGNCDVFCPEDGGPQAAKPRFFSSLESYRKYAGQNGFFIQQDGDRRTIYGSMAHKSYRLTLEAAADRARFDDGQVELEIRPSRNAVLGWRVLAAGADPPPVFSMLPYLQLKLLLESISNPRRLNYVNAATIQVNASVHHEDSPVPR